MKKLSLRTRLTLIVTLIMVILCTLISFASLLNAKDSFSVFAYPISIISKDAIDAELVELATSISYSDSVGETIPFRSIQTIFSAKIAETYTLGVSNFKWTNLIIMVVAVILCSLSVWFLSGLALSPLKKLSENIKSIDEKELDYRLKQNSAKDEVSNLTNSFNNMMSKIQSAFLREKRFTDGIAHEINTPLTILKTNLQVFDECENPLIEDYIETLMLVKKETEHMIELVDKMKSLTRKESLIKEDCNLEDIVLNVASDYQEKAKELDVKINLQTKNVTHKVNSLLIKQALRNLIDNAFKYALDGKEITISLTESDTDISITVSDKGKGILECDRTKIFEPFFRVEKSRNRNNAGVGLGLSITAEIVNQHDGEIKCEQNVFGGCDFVITFCK